MTDIHGDFYSAVSRYNKMYRDQTVVIKFGGELINEDAALRAIYKQAITLKNFGCNSILPHGGGTQIDEHLIRAGLESRKIDGVRDTTPEALEIIAACMSELNTRLTRIFREVSLEIHSDVTPWGMGGCDGSTIIATPKFDGTLTGKVTKVDAAMLAAISAGNNVPIIHPICAGEDTPMLNVNADDVAAALAQAMGAKRLILCSNTYVKDKQGNRINRITDTEVDGLIADGTLTGGMIAKVKAAAKVVESGAVEGVVIIDGKEPLAVARELYSDEGSGTLIVKSTAKPDLGNKPVF